MKKLLFIFVVALMLVSCDSPVQENEEQPVVETTEETKVEETKEEPEQVIEEQKPQEEKAVEEPKKEQPVKETKEEQPAEEPKEEPVEETPVEQPEETKVEEVTEEVEPEVIKEQPEEIVEEPEVEEQPVEETEEETEEFIFTGKWIDVNYTDGDFGIPYFCVPKGYDPYAYSYFIIGTEDRCDFPMVKFEKTNVELTHKKKDKYKDYTFAFWKFNSSDRSRTFQPEVEVYEISVSSDFRYDSLLLFYHDLYMSSDPMNIAYLLTKENDKWYIRSAARINLYNYLPEKDEAKYTAKVISYYN